MNSLLTIELKDEMSVPKVIFKGVEVKLKKEIVFHWETDSSFSLAGLTYVIEHLTREQGYSKSNRVERRVGGHVLE